MAKKVIRDIIIFVIIFIIMCSTIIIRDLNDLDELWNYNFAKNIAEGRLPYKDFNMIQMPLLPIVCSIFLKIFGNQLFTMRILSIFLNSFILFFIYKIMKLLKLNENLTYILLIGIYSVYYNYFSIDYNFSILLITLIGIYIELYFINKNKSVIISNIKIDFGLGILIGCTILLKQTTGLFISLIFVFYKVLIVLKKSEVKEILKIMVARLLGIFIPICIMIIYLSVNHIWLEFMDYAIYGIKTFSNYIPYTFLLKNSKINIKFLSILVPTIIIYMYVRTIIKEQKTQEDKNIFVLFCYSVASLIVVFPISDIIHFLIGSMPAIISMLYIIYLEIKKVINKEKNIIFIKEYVKAFSVILTVIFFITSITITINYLNNDRFSKLKHYRFIPSQIDDDILKIDSYIQEKNLEKQNVYILDATACLYMIPIDKYNKDYDMFLKGNLGAKGEKGQIDKLKNENNAFILILNDNYSRNWQNPEKVRKYIIDNWSKIDTVGNFDVYTRST